MPPAVFHIAAEQCPGCGVAWNEREQCPQCACSRQDIEALIHSAGGRYNQARSAAAEGRFDDARRLIAEARALGLSHDALDRLEALVAAAGGNWQTLRLDLLPADWQAAFSKFSLGEEYEAARTALQRSEFSLALTASERCIEAAPWLLPAWIVRLLALEASGQGVEAERLREGLLPGFPQNPVLLRLRFTSPDVPAVEQPVVAQEQTGLPGSPLRRWHLVLAIAGSLGIGLLLGPLVRPAGPTATTASLRTPPTPTVAIPSMTQPSETAQTGGVPATKGISRTVPEATPPRHRRSISEATTPRNGQFPPVLAKDVATEHTRADRRVARRWFNSAWRSYKSADYARALQFTNAVLSLTPHSYLLEEALLLRARSAEKAGRPDTDTLYRAIADQAPTSAYAPVGLFHAARLSIKQGKQTEAALLIGRIKSRYPGSRMNRRADLLQLQEKER